MAEGYEPRPYNTSVFEKMLGFISSNKTYYIPNNYRGVLFTFDSNSTGNGMYFIWSTTVGTVDYKVISAASKINLIGNVNQVTISVTSGSILLCFVIDFDSQGFTNFK